MHKIHKLDSVRRMTAEQHNTAASSILDQLHTQFPWARVEPLRAYRSKLDFSSLDLLAAIPSPAIPSADKMLADFREYLLTSVCTGQNVCTDSRMTLQYGENQVDVAFVPAACFDMAVDYHSYQELGNLISQMAHARELSLREDRLTYRVREGYSFIADLELANSWSHALEILGYSHSEWLKGFNTLEDIFAFVTSSPLFQADVFTDKKAQKSGARPSLRAQFSEWLEHQVLPASLADPLPWLFSRVPGFETRLNAAITKDQNRNKR